MSKVHFVNIFQIRRFYNEGFKIKTQKNDFNLKYLNDKKFLINPRCSKFLE